MIKTKVSGSHGQGRYANLRYCTSATFDGQPNPLMQLWSTGRAPAEDAIAHFLTRPEQGLQLKAEEIDWVDPPVGGYARRVYESGQAARMTEGRQ